MAFKAGPSCFHFPPPTLAYTAFASLILPLCTPSLTPSNPAVIVPLNKTDTNAISSSINQVNSISIVFVTLMWNAVKHFQKYIQKNLLSTVNIINKPRGKKSQNNQTKTEAIFEMQKQKKTSTLQTHSINICLFMY